MLERKRAEVLQGLELTVDGKRTALEVAGGAKASFPPGSGGLPTSRFEFRLDRLRRLAALRAPS